MQTPQSTGIFIPTHKKGLFIVAFEKFLLDHHNIIPTFQKAKNRNSCEVQFLFKKKEQLLRTIRWNFKNAKKFIEENLYILDTNKVNKWLKLKKTLHSTGTFPKYNVINVENYSPLLSPRQLSLRSASTIDLTSDSFQAYEPEVIVLDDCHSSNNTIRRRTNNITIEVIDLDETSKSLPTTSKSIGSNIQAVEKRSKPSLCSSLSGNEVTIVKSTFEQKSNSSNLRHSKRKKSNLIETPIKSQLRKLACLEKRLSYLSNLSEASKNKANETKGKKRKLCDVSNIIPKGFSNVESQNTKPLSDGVLKYYTEIGKAMNKRKKSNSPKRKQLLNKVVSNKKSSLTPLVKKPKEKTPNHKQKLHFPTYSKNSSPSLYKRQNVTLTKKAKCNHESNIFNPNPNVDVDGLRPIAIDGSNVAIGHGKGTFSTKGLKICVDYFVNQGHKQLKVFLPLHRQNFFSKQLLEELRSKCDMVFTPSRVINGRRTTSYDDRFIVQYAVEFGAVIVSTDNFRDLLVENPRWTKAIQERLLMFTWIDDFLMFPMDPMGKNGPTLEEFLKF